MSQEIKPCCEPMSILKNPSSQCNIELDEEGKLASCDDTGDRFPIVKFCPWCGAKVGEENQNATVH